jgi:hypothetical protein
VLRLIEETQSILKDSLSLTKTNQDEVKQSLEVLQRLGKQAKKQSNNNQTTMEQTTEQQSNMQSIN